MTDLNAKYYDCDKKRTRKRHDYLKSVFNCSAVDISIRIDTFFTTCDIF